MNTNLLAIAAQLSDDALRAKVKLLALCSREVTVELIAHLAVLEVRKLHCSEGPGSLFRYCTEILRFSEAAACNRIKAARAARKFPVVLDPARRWVCEPDGRPPPGAAPHSGESHCDPRGGDGNDAETGRQARGPSRPAARRSAIHPKAARAERRGRGIRHCHARVGADGGRALGFGPEPSEPDDGNSRGRETNDGGRRPARRPASGGD